MAFLRGKCSFLKKKWKECVIFVIRLGTGDFFFLVYLRRKGGDDVAAEETRMNNDMTQDERWNVLMRLCLFVV